MGTTIKKDQHAEKKAAGEIQVFVKKRNSTVVILSVIIGKKTMRL